MVKITDSDEDLARNLLRCYYKNYYNNISKLDVDDEFIERIVEAKMLYQDSRKEWMHFAKAIRPFIQELLKQEKQS